MQNTFLGYDVNNQWDYENGFYLTSHLTRIPKMLAHYELYKSITHLPGAIVECGVFKGASLIRFCTFREILESPYSRKIIGFDAFGDFPEPADPDDQTFVREFEGAAGAGIPEQELDEALCLKGFRNYELVPGDIMESVPTYTRAHPEFRIALLHIDVDVYAPTTVVLEHLYQRLVPGGLLVLDDYGTVSGETRAVEEFFDSAMPTMNKLSISHIPSYIRKQEE